MKTTTPKPADREAVNKRTDREALKKPRLIERVLAHEMRLSEFLGFLILVGIPYFLIGVVWTLTHTSHLAEVDNDVDKVISFLGSIVCWPILLISDVTMT